MAFDPIAIGVRDWVPLGLSRHRAIMSTGRRKLNPVLRIRKTSKCCPIKGGHLQSARAVAL